MEQRNAILNLNDNLVSVFGRCTDEGANAVEIVVFYGMELHDEVGAIVYLNSCACHFFRFIKKLIKTKNG